MAMLWGFDHSCRGAEHCRTAGPWGSAGWECRWLSLSCCGNGTWAPEAPAGLGGGGPSARPGPAARGQQRPASGGAQSRPQEQQPCLPRCQVPVAAVQEEKWVWKSFKKSVTNVTTRMCSAGGSAAVCGALRAQARSAGRLAGTGTLLGALYLKGAACCATGPRGAGLGVPQ